MLSEKDNMILISGGTFTMGSDKDEDDERPSIKVTLKSFYMGKYPVTNKRYKLFNPEHKGQWCVPDYPVETVSWYDAVKYCNWLSENEWFERCYNGNGDNIVCDFNKNGYRLPTEAEWEYACRGRTTTEYYWGDKMNEDYCWHDKNSKDQVDPAGQKQPNSWGLYDMSGNVWEWCWDWYGDYPSTDVNNPVKPVVYWQPLPSESKYHVKNPAGPKSGSHRVARGGSWYDAFHRCRSAYRFFGKADDPDECFGFRLVRNSR